MWVANHFRIFSKLKWTHPLTKLTQIRVAMWKIFGSGRNMYVIEKPS
jgi:hypothetical protein